MSILITGGCGFIGSHLCDYFTQRGEAVTVLDNLSSGKRSNLRQPDRVTVIEGDVADRALIEKLMPQAQRVFHLAAIASVTRCTEEPELATRTNLLGTQHMFDAAAAHGVPVIYASSAAIYGDNPAIPLAETALPAPLTLYGRQKLENEAIAARAFAQHGVPSIGFRFFNVYGPRQDPSSPYSGVISKFIDAAQAGRPLTMFGDGEQTRDFIYVGDVVTALVAAAPSTGAQVLNVCTGQATNLKQLAHIITELLGVAAQPIDHQPPRLGDIRHSLGDPQAVMRELHIKKWTLLAAGLAASLAPDA